MYGQTSMSGMPDLYTENRKRLVLIVEDEYVNRELLKAYLENSYELIFAETGGAAEAATDDAEAAAAQVIELPQGTMMLEWLDDGATAHFYVDDPGVGEGGECTVRFDK